MTPRILTALAFVAMTAVPAAAQEGPVCYNSGQSYSPGSVIPIGNVANTCAKAPGSGGMVWVPVADAEVNCFYGGEEYSRGSMIAVGTKVIACAKGVWFVKED